MFGNLFIFPDLITFVSRYYMFNKQDENTRTSMSRSISKIIVENKIQQ